MKINNIADNNKFWQAVKPLFSDKINHNETINLIGNGVTWSNDEEIAKTSNKCFCNIDKNLSLPENPSIKEDPVILALYWSCCTCIAKYNDHPGKASITIKMTSMDNPKFSFRFVSLNEILDGATGIFAEIIKQNKDVVSFYVFHNFSNALPSCFFSTALKYADIRMVFEKDDKTEKKNYRTISILPNVSKVYERLMYQCITKCTLFW